MKQLVIGILAHVDAGKTTLSEGMLYLTGSIRKLGRVDNKDAFLDTYELERSRGITIFSKQAVLNLGEHTVTLLDTPGHVDFSAEMERTLQVLDCAILVISATDGIQGHTETLWRLLRQYRIPVFLFINKVDLINKEGLIDKTGAEHSRYIALMKELKERLDDNCVDFTAEKNELWENLALCDGEVLERFLENGILTDQDIKKLVMDRKVFPCYFGSALKMEGLEEFLNGLGYYLDPPSYPETFGAKVFKISRDDNQAAGQPGSRLTHLKVTGGSLRVKDLLMGEKVNQIRIYSGSKFESVGEAGAGTVCAVTGPLGTYPGQGLGAEADTERFLLEPVLTYQVILPCDCDVHEMLANLRLLEEEEPQLRIVWNESLREIQAQVMGEVQTEVLQSLIQQRFGVQVGFGTGNIVYKETIRKPVEGVGHFEPLRHYAEVHLLMEPGDPGSGLRFDTCCSEDVLDRNWQRLILTHLQEREHRGVLIGAEITDMKITLLAGRAHTKHTEGGDFRQATYRAVRQGLKEAGCRLLEPYYAFRLEVPTEAVGRAMADIERMQGRFDPPDTEGDLSVLCGHAPVINMRDYSKEVISYTKGRGRISCWMNGYEPCHNEDAIVCAVRYDSEADPDHPTGSVFCSHGAGYLVPWNEVKQHMHVESVWKQNHLPIDSAGVAEMVRPVSSACDYGADDKELEEIFIRTYGERKQRPAGGKTFVAAERPNTYGKSVTEDMPEYLLVDGYNIIFAWDELRELAEVTIEGARYKLMDMMCNYQGYKKCTLILVFDAYKVSGNTGEAIDYHNIHVVYTKEAETADQYIEKLAHKMGRKYQVTVATSDGQEQLIIRGQGCRLLSASDLMEEIEWMNRQLEEEKKRMPMPEKNYLLQHAGQELTQYLESVRLGKQDE